MMNKLVALFNSLRIVLFGVVLVLVFFTLSYLGVLKWGSIKVEQEKYITVIGSYSKQNKNQIATFTAGVNVVNSDKAKAVSEANTKSQKILDAVKAFGIDTKDIKTSSVNINQDQESYYDNGVQKYRGGDWRVGMTVDITLRDITKAGDLTTLIAGLETAYLYGPNFTVDNSKVDDSALLNEALINANKKALSLATSGGKKLGELIRIIEGDNTAFDINPKIYSSGMGGGGGTPIEPGSTTVTKTVTATYRLD